MLREELALNHRRIVEVLLCSLVRAQVTEVAVVVVERK